MAVSKDEKTKKWYFYGRYKDFDGEAHQYKKRGFDTKTQAKIAESQFLKELTEKKKGKVKFKVIYDEYFKYQKQQTKASSYVSLSNRSDKHILPFFSDLYVDEIKPAHVRKWKDEMNKKGLSLEYRKDIFTALQTIMNYGARYYPVNTTAVVAEGNFKEPTVNKKEMDFWTLDEFNRFDEVIDDLEYRVFYNFLYWTGCRRGEAQALNWNDFSEGFRTVNISKSVTHKVPGELYIIQTTKTKNSVRTISIPNRLISLLEKHYKEQEQIDGFTRNCFVFGLNRPLTDTTIERRKNQYCKLAEVKQIRIHDFRHSHASYLISNMPNDKNVILAISKRLGHSSPTTTLSIYAHMMPEQEDMILSMLNNA